VSASRPLLKRAREGIKRPLQSAFAAALTARLDRRPRTAADLDELRPRTILCSRTDRIGDLLCSTPLIQAAHRRWPEARLLLVAGPKNRAVLRGLPFVEEAPVFRRDPRSWAGIALWARRQSVDLSISLRAESMAGAWISAWSGAPVRCATHRTYAAPSCNLLLGADDRHQVSRYAHAAEVLGFPSDALRPVFVPSPDAERKGAAIAAALMPGGGRPLVGLQIPNRGSGRHAVRAWPAEHVLALTRSLAEDGCRVVLCGTGAERLEAEAVASAVPEAVVAPAAPLDVFAALQGHLDLFIAQFTGTLHLADAMGVATLAFGLARQVEIWGPIGPQHRCVGAARASEIRVEQLLQAARELLHGRGERRLERRA